jgi:cytosine/adenosine deaminase-related metal-dependent hydrolase
MEATGVLVRDGLIEHVGAAEDPVAEGVPAIDLGGRLLMPGLIDAHAHIKSPPLEPMAGAEPVWPQPPAHFVAAGLQRMLRMGLTTVHRRRFLR